MSPTDKTSRGAEETALTGKPGASVEKCTCGAVENGAHPVLAGARERGRAPPARQRLQARSGRAPRAYRGAAGGCVPRGAVLPRAGPLSGFWAGWAAGMGLWSGSRGRTLLGCVGTWRPAPAGPSGGTSAQWPEVGAFMPWRSVRWAWMSQRRAAWRFEQACPSQCLLPTWLAGSSLGVFCPWGSVLAATNLGRRALLQALSAMQYG